MKVVCACETGIVVSFMIALKTKQIFSDLGIDARVEHVKLETVDQTNADLYIVSESVTDQPVIQKINQDKLIALKRVTDKREIKNKLEAKLVLNA